MTYGILDIPIFRPICDEPIEFTFLLFFLSLVQLVFLEQSM